MALPRNFRPGMQGEPDLIQWIKSALNGAYPLVFQRVPEPARLMAPAGDQPFGSRKAAHQGTRAGVAADSLPDRRLRAIAQRGPAVMKNHGGRPIASIGCRASLAAHTPQAHHTNVTHWD